jgi:hypothetical protein
MDRLRPSIADRDGFREAAAVVLTLLASAAVGVVIFVYGAAVRDVCRDAGVNAALANLLAVFACAPILAALYSIDA